MKKLRLKDVQKYIEDNISVFHQKRIASLNQLKLDVVLKKKNPYLFKAKYFLTSERIVKSLTDAFISSNEETIFGDWLEGLAIFINQKVYNGKKSGINGIDLEFEKEGIRYIVNIKSGPNWGNHSAIQKMRLDFAAAAKTLRTSGAKTVVIAVNGCCYGIDNRPDKGDYFKYCGRVFWQFISGNDSLFTDLIEPLAFDAKQKNKEFEESYSKMINKFVKHFNETYLAKDGGIDWVKLVKFNSEGKYNLKN